MFSFYIPAIVMISLYYKIFAEIRRRAKNAKKRYGKTNNEKSKSTIGVNIRKLLTSLLLRSKNVGVKSGSSPSPSQLQTLQVVETTNGTTDVELNNLLPSNDGNNSQNDKIEKINDLKIKRLANSVVQTQSSAK